MEIKDCPLCDGEGEVQAGIKRGTYADPIMRTCPLCRGSRRVLEDVAEDFDEESYWETYEEYTYEDWKADQYYREDDA